MATVTSSDPMAGLPTGSAAVPKPRAKADIDPQLQTQLRALQSQAAAEAIARPQGLQAKWMMPESAADGWQGSVFDYDGMAQPFDRAQSNTWFTEATSNPASPGTTGDLIATTTQIDYLAVMERSFRARHTMSRARAMCHAMGRKGGHGSANGPLIQSVLEYLNGIIQEGKSGGA